MKINVVGYILNDNVNCAYFNERKGECITKIPKVIPNCTRSIFSNQILYQGRRTEGGEVLIVVVIVLCVTGYRPTTAVSCWEL